MIQTLRGLICVACLAVAGHATSVNAAVKAVSPQGFEVETSVSISAAPDKVYAAMTRVADWWSGAHTFGGQASNLTLDPHAGGCFCERTSGVEVRHMTVIFVEPGKILRLGGALGPLQGEGVSGALTLVIRPTPTGSVLVGNYVVGGYLRKGSDFWAGPVDSVLGQQIERLKRLAETGAADPPGL